jgi:Ndr family
MIQRGFSHFIFSDIANFQAFFNYIDMRAMLENFCVYHVNAPGQEENAPALPDE